MTALYTDAVDVLLVEDDAEVRRVLGECLADDGLTVAPARDGVEALEYLRSGRPVGMVLTDLEMPRLDGYELIRILRDDYPGVPVIAVSGTLPMHWPRHEVTIAKPVRLTELLRVIHDALNRKEAATWPQQSSR